MSQEVNPYLVTSVDLTTSMPYDNELDENLMKVKHQQRITNKERADSKKSNSRLIHPHKHQNHKTHLYTYEGSRVHQHL